MTAFWAYGSDTLNTIMMWGFVLIVAGAILVCAIGDLRHPPTRRCGKSGRCRMSARK